MRAILLTAVLLATLFAGCTTSDDTLRIAFVGKDTAVEPHADPARLARWISDETGRPAEVFFFSTSTAALAAVSAGQADIASVDGAAGWLGWKQLGLEVIASELRSDGRDHYIASAWVTEDSHVEDVDDFKGITSCHTGATKSAGMFMPMGYLVREGFIDASGYPDDISQVQQMAMDFFDSPVIGGAYAGYDGALRCLSEGMGDVAFVRDTTPADYCTPPALDWCLPLEEYRQVVEFGPVPEHPFMVGPHVDAGTRAALVDALLALNSEAGRDILDGVFGTTGIGATDSQTHLGGYGGLIGQLPGIEAYAKGN